MFDDEIHSGYVTPEEAHNREDLSIMDGLWKLHDEANIVIAHNAKGFDVPRINTRLFINGYAPPAPYQVIDTLYHYRKQFKFSHNRLDYINKVMLLDRKLSNEGMGLWVRCVDGVTVEEQQKGLDEMKEYNDQDTFILEENYLRFRPWIKNHPNIAVYMDNDELTCGICGSTRLRLANSDYGTPVNKYPTYRCENCGGLAGRGRKSDIMAHQRKNLLSPVAR